MGAAVTQTLESLSDALETTGDIQSIVRTMKALSAASIRQFERAEEALGDYAHTVDLGLTALLHDRRDRGLPLPRTGVEGSTRTALIVVGFSVVSVEVRNPKIIGWFIRRGMSEFSAALNIAFEALPAMTAALVQGRRFISHPFAAIPDAIRSANDWLRAYEKEA